MLIQALKETNVFLGNRLKQFTLGKLFKSEEHRDVADEFTLFRNMLKAEKAGQVRILTGPDFLMFRSGVPTRSVVVIPKPTSKATIKLKNQLFDYSEDLNKDLLCLNLTRLGLGLVDSTESYLILGALQIGSQYSNDKLEVTVNGVTSSYGFNAGDYGGIFKQNKFKLEITKELIEKQTYTFDTGLSTISYLTSSLQSKEGDNYVVAPCNLTYKVEKNSCITLLNLHTYKENSFLLLTIEG